MNHLNLENMKKFLMAFAVTLLGGLFASHADACTGISLTAQDGSLHAKADIPKGLPSATQFTSATDQTAMKFYYRTAWNSSIRCIDLKAIDFTAVRYQSHPLDKVQEQPVEMVRIC